MELDNNWVSFMITRGPIRGSQKDRIGLLIKIKARQDVEEFIRGLGKGGKLSLADAVGDTWQNGNPSGPALEYYDIPNQFESKTVYTLQNLGEPPIIVPYNDRAARNGLPQPVVGEIVNLAFLRLAGISDPDGVTVGIAGAYSNDYLTKLKTMLPNAIKQFLQDYVVPVTINLQVISKS